MDITIIDTADLNYALLTLSTANAVSCEYFTDAPELKLRRLQQAQQSELLKEGIVGYALCVFKSPVWIADVFRCPPTKNQPLKDYIKYDLNRGYSKSVSSNITIKEGENHNED